MKKYLVQIVMIFIVSVFLSESSYPALKDFKQGYEKEESSKSGNSSSSNSNSNSNSDSGDDGCAGCIGEAAGEICVEIFLKVWLGLNTALEYSRYPYHQNEKSNFICNYFMDSDIQRSPESEVVNVGDKDNADQADSKMCFDGKSWFLTLEGGGQNAFENGKGGFARLSGRIFKLIGPEIEAKRLIDSNDDHLDYYAIGANIPIVQFSGFMPDFYFQGVFLRGILERRGSAYGIIINSYPVKPLSLMLRFGRQNYGNIKGQDYGNMKFYDFEGRAGIIINRFEVFAGYRHVGSEYTELKGPIAGVKVFF